MKKLFAIISAIIALTTISWGQHFVPVWTGNGVDQENFYFSKAILNGINLEAGDEIAIFDSIYCVGTEVITQPLSSSEYLSVITSRDDEFTTEVDGYTIGNSISYKIWDNSEGMEIDSVVATYISGSNIFVASGTVSAEITGILVFDITTEVIPLGGGTTTGDGTYDYNGSASLVATPATGYNFVNWTETNSGDTVSVNSNYSFTVINDSSFTANFVLQSFNIATTANPTSGGSVSGGGPHNYNESATLIANPNTGYDFVNWTETNSGDTVSVNSNYSFTVVNDSSFFANFVLQSFNIAATANPTSGGSVSGGGPHNYNETATLIANPNTGYNFVNWTETNSGDTVSVNSNYSFTVVNDSSFSANFVLQSFNIAATANPTSGGSVSGGGPHNYNETATLVANSNTGYNFVNWTENSSGDTISVISTLNITVISDSSFTANFALQSFTINTAINPVNSGTVLGGGSYDYNETAVLTASPEPGYEFLNWIETNSGEVQSINPTLSFTVISDSSFTANFELKSFKLSASSLPGIGGEISDTGTYTYGAVATLIASPSEGYDFVNWTEAISGETVSFNSSFDVTVISDTSFFANFVIQSFSISAIVNPGGSGTITGTGSYNYNETATLTAAPAAGYDFVNWTETNSGDTASTNPGFDVLVTSDSSFIANFIRIYNISASANPTGGGTISGFGPYAEGSLVNISATTNAGYSFVNWTENSTEVSTNTDYSFTATADRTLVANFTGSQTITLYEAWNIMSFYVTPPDPDMSVILAPLVSEGSLDKVQNEKGKAFENVAIIGWVNEIGDWAQTEGYKIRVNTDTQLNISGEVITLPGSIPLETGWNIMSFPSPEMQNSQDMVADLISSGELVKVQDQTGSAIVYIAPNWEYGFLNFNPGGGYKINVNTNTSITIDALPPNKSAAIQKDTFIPKHFSPSWTGNGYNHMNIYILPEDGMEAGDEIAAFDGKVCIGIGEVDPTKDYISLVATMDDPLTIKQDGFINGNNIQLRVWNNRMNKESLLEGISFHEPDKNKYMEYGTSLIQVNLKNSDTNQGWSLGNAYPNPFNDFTNISYSVAEETNVRIEIYNATGQKIKIITDEIKVAGEYTIHWDRTNQNGKQVSSGTYFYRMTTNNYSEVKTLIYMDR